MLVAHAAVSQTLSVDERKFLIDLLEANAKKFLHDIEHVSDDQWKFKPASNAWSVGEARSTLLYRKAYCILLFRRHC